MANVIKLNYTANEINETLAELQDVRIGADETVYRSAGEAVRTQIDNLAQNIDDVSNVINLLDIGMGENLFNVETVVDGKFVNAERVAGDKSVLQDSANYSVSDWIKVESSTTYIIHATNDNFNITIHFCDNNDILVANSFMFARDVIFVTPANCTKLRFSGKTTIIKSGEFMLVKSDNSDNLFNDVGVTTDTALESGTANDNTSNTISSLGYSVSDWIKIDKYTICCMLQRTNYYTFMQR